MRGTGPQVRWGRETDRKGGRREGGRERGTHPEILTFLDIISPNRGTARREIDTGLIIGLLPFKSRVLEMFGLGNLCKIATNRFTRRHVTYSRCD